MKAKFVLLNMLVVLALVLGACVMTPPAAQPTAAPQATAASQQAAPTTAPAAPAATEAPPAPAGKHRGVLDPRPAVPVLRLHGTQVKDEAEKLGIDIQTLDGQNQVHQADRRRRSGHRQEGRRHPDQPDHRRRHGPRGQGSCRRRHPGRHRRPHRLRRRYAGARRRRQRAGRRAAGQGLARAVPQGRHHLRADRHPRRHPGHRPLQGPAQHHRQPSRDQGRLPADRRVRPRQGPLASPRTASAPPPTRTPSSPPTTTWPSARSKPSRRPA